MKNFKPSALAKREHERAAGLAIDRSNRHDREMGVQLTEQYVRATDGMREVLKFGCMMMMLRAHLAQRGQGSGNGIKGDGIKGWLDEHAPEVARQTAQRFESVAQAVAQQYALPANIAKRLTFEQLVTSDAKVLPANARKAQADVFGFVAGTSQKSWLDQFRNATNGSSGHGSGRKKLTAEQIIAQLREACIKATESLHAISLSRAYYTLNEAELDAFIEWNETLSTEGKAWRRKSQREREEVAREHIAKHIK